MCGEYSRYDLSTPFVQGGNAIGTDSFIMGWFPVPSIDTNNDERRIPKVIAVQNENWKDSGRWIKMTADGELCGREFPECPFCSFDHPCDHEDDSTEVIDVPKCSKCQGAYYIPSPSCPVCRGRRQDIRVTYKSAMRIGGKQIARRYARDIAAIPGAYIHVPELCGDPFMFRSDIGIKGLCMPIWTSL